MRAVAYHGPARHVGADVAIEAVGGPASFELAVSLARPGGPPPP